MHIACPHCHNPIEVVEGPPEEILCPSCGSSFHLERGATTSLLPLAEQPNLGRFVLREKLGVGAFGVVYKAHDPDLDRVVAIKVPRSGNVGGDDHRDRFLREARNVAQLRHPGIVAVLEVGQHDQLPYLVSEFVPGLNLADWLTAHRPTIAQAVDLVVQLADALQYAHEHGVVHRDLKPSNVMLEPVEAPVVDAPGSPTLPIPGRPRLMDFGLAKREAGEITMTVEGQVLGTPAYMSPEQARGESHTVDGRGDVYSLGVVLYELLTGELPFRGNTRMLLHQVLHDDPKPPRRLDDRIPRDLETICLKAMAKEPAWRYHTAGDFAADLRAFRDGRPILARPSTAWERGAKWARRRPAAAALLAVSVLAVLTVLTVVLVYNTHLQAALHATQKAKGEVEEQRDAAEKATADARARLEQSLRSQYAAQLALVATLWERDPIRGRQFLDDPQRCPPELRDFTWGWLNRLCRRERFTLRGHSGAINAIAYAPDGKTLATGSDDKTVRLWDTLTGKPRAVLSNPGDVISTVAFSPDGKTLATGGPDRTVKLWDTGTGQERGRLKQHGHWVSSVAFSADGKTLASGSLDGIVHLWDPATLVERASHQTGAVWVRSLALSPDGHTVATGSHDGTVKLWDWVADRERTVFDKSIGVAYKNQGGPVTAIAFAPDGKTLAWICTAELQMWDLETMKERASFSLRFNGAYPGSLSFSPDGHVLAAGCGGLEEVPASVKFWDAHTGQSLGIIRGHAGKHLAAVFAPDGRTLAFGSSDGLVEVWDMAGDPERATVQAYPDGVWSVAFAPDGKTLASTCGEWWKKWQGKEPPTLKLWDPATARERLALRGHDGYATAVAFSPDGKTLASAGWDRTVKLWDVVEDRERATLRGHTDPIWCMAFAPDGRTLATGSGDPAGRNGAAGNGEPVPDDKPGEVRLWDTARGQTRAVLSGHRSGIFALAYSPDGATLASASWDGTVKLWDPATGQERATLAEEGISPAARPSSEVWCLAFSPDGKTLAAGTGELRVRTRPGEVRLWDLGTRRVRLTLRGHTGGVFAVAYSPDGKTLATGSNDATVKLWDAVTGQERATLSGHTRWVRAVAFSPDGKTLATGSGDGTVKFWEAAWKEEK